jgi:hypothetical protein
VHDGLDERGRERLDDDRRELCVGRVDDAAVAGVELRFGAQQAAADTGDDAAEADPSWCR